MEMTTNHRHIEAAAKAGRPYRIIVGEHETTASTERNARKAFGRLASRVPNGTRGYISVNGFCYLAGEVTTLGWSEVR